MTIFEILTILLESGTFLILLRGIFILGKMVQKIETIEKDVAVIKSNLHSIDMRLTRLEGRFDDRGYWESRQMRKTGTEHKR